MKRRSNKQKIKLVLAGMLAAGMIGCAERRREMVNDTYVTDKGYYHSQTGMYWPYPWNFYSPGTGYYGGSLGWSQTPHRMTRGVSTVPVIMTNSYVPSRYSAPLPNIPPPAPRASQIYSAPISSPASSSYRSPTVTSGTTVSRPTTAPSTSKPSGISSGARSGGFGSSAGSSSGS